MTSPQSEEDLRDELLERCKKLVDRLGIQGIDSWRVPDIGNIGICTADDVLYVEIRSPKLNSDVRVYDGFYDTFHPELAETIVLPALRRFMILDDLASI